MLDFFLLFMEVKLNDQKCLEIMRGVKRERLSLHSPKINGKYLG